MEDKANLPEVAIPVGLDKGTWLHSLLAALRQTLMTHYLPPHESEKATKFKSS